MAKKCPLTCKKCMKHDCEWYIQVMGTDKNTGEQVNEFACSMSWLPMLLIENTSSQNQTGAAVESFRNEMVRVSDVTPLLMAATQNRGVNKS